MLSFSAIAIILIILGSIAEGIAFLQFKKPLFAYFREWNAGRLGHDPESFTSPIGFYAAKAALFLYFVGGVMIVILWYSPEA